MKVEETVLQGVKLVSLDVYGDERGFFVERFNADRFKEHDLPANFLQINHSRSAPGVIRGLHFQPSPAQGKLVGVVHGAIWDVAVDVRPDSPTKGMSYGVELSAENGKLLWVPPGFAHGFAVIGEHPADVMYCVTATYNPKSEQGIHWNDKDLKVAWPFAKMTFPEGEPVISERDNQQPSYASYMQNPAVWSD